MTGQTDTIGWVAPTTLQTLIAEARSPGGAIGVGLSLDGDGRPHYQVDYKGQAVVLPSRLGFVLADQHRLERDFGVQSIETGTRDEMWEQPWGERQFISDCHTELRVRLKEQSREGRVLDLVFRLFDDGIGFRYGFPEQAGLETVNIAEELTEFDMAEASTAWWIPAGEWSRYEYLYQKTPLAEVGQAHTPITLRTQTGLHIAVHEAALIDYPAFWFNHIEGQRFKTRLSPASQGPAAICAAPFFTPWRTIQISDTAGKLVESDLILNLNAPNVLGDVSWVVPHKYVGIWWEMHLGQKTWEAGPLHGATTQRAKDYIDFAAANGFRGVLIEGWNTGWTKDWVRRGLEFDFLTAYPDFDIEAVAAYAREKGVRIIGHHETAGNIALYETQLSAALDLYQRLGIDSVKTGYVADAGGVRAKDAEGRIVYAWHDSQLMARHHLKVVSEAAKRKIAINAHEPIKDTGLRRTYPNWVAREGARGMEYNGWGKPPNPPEHEINLVFTRLLSGPMDYTPGVLSLEGNGQPLQSTLARQLALYVLLYSPVQMAADTMENLARHPVPLKFISEVPTDWAETRVLCGEVGDFVVMARKDRHSADWYIGAATDEDERRLEVTLDFLEDGQVYEAQIYRDADDTHYVGETRHHYVYETHQVTKGAILNLELAAGGGQAIRLVAQAAG